MNAKEVSAEKSGAQRYNTELSRWLHVTSYSRVNWSHVKREDPEMLNHRPCPANQAQPTHICGFNWPISAQILNLLAVTWEPQLWLKLHVLGWTFLKHNHLCIICQLASEHCLDEAMEALLSDFLQEEEKNNKLPGVEQWAKLTLQFSFYLVLARLTFTSH